MARVMYYIKAQNIHVLTYAYNRLVPGGVVEAHCTNLITLSIWDQTLPFYMALHAVSKVSRGLLCWLSWLIHINVLTLIAVHA
jgi:hypothetical protein